MNDLLGQLGRRADDASLSQLMATEGINVQEQLYLPEGEFNAYIEMPAEGYALVFTVEAVLTGDLHTPIAISPLCLSGIFIYMMNVDDYAQFAGPLPLGLPKPLNRDVLGRTFGVSDWSETDTSGQVTAERWEIGPDRRIHASYQEDGHHVCVLSVSQPDVQVNS